MNSYFTNASLSCHLSGSQEVLPNVALNSTTYDPVRHFSSYGAAVAQNRIYSTPFYSPQDNVVFGSGRTPYDYGSNVFYQDKDVLPSCRQSLGQGAQGSLAQDYASEHGRGASQEAKSPVQIYPWMQRMNSHSGKYLGKRDTFGSGAGFLYDSKPTFYHPIKHWRSSPSPGNKCLLSLREIPFGRCVEQKRSPFKTKLNFLSFFMALWEHVPHLPCITTRQLIGKQGCIN